MIGAIKDFGESLVNKVEEFVPDQLASVAGNIPGLQQLGTVGNLFQSAMSGNFGDLFSPQNLLSAASLFAGPFAPAVQKFGPAVLGVATQLANGDLDLAQLGKEIAGLAGGQQFVSLAENFLGGDVNLPGLVQDGVGLLRSNPELAAKIDEISRRTGVEPEQILNFIMNPNLGNILQGGMPQVSVPGFAGGMINLSRS